MSATSEQRLRISGIADAWEPQVESEISRDLRAILADSERLAEVEKAVARVDLVEATPHSAVGYWQVWWPDDEERRSGDLIEGPMRTLVEANAVARGFRAGAKAVLDAVPGDTE